MQKNVQKKNNLVQGVFDKVFDKYDIMNDLMSLGVHRSWKKKINSNDESPKRLQAHRCWIRDWRYS